MVAAILISSIGFQSNFWVLSVLIFLVGACQHGVSGVAGSYIAQSYPIHFRATGTTWGYGCGRIGGTLGPLFGGFLLAMKLPIGYNLMCFGCVIFLAAIIVSFSKDFSRQKPVVERLQAQTASR